MSIKIQVYPFLSPRIIEVLAPLDDVTVQQLVDSIRAWEDSDEGINYPRLIDAAGKEALGGGVSVGITATLQNAKVMFTGRTTALDNGFGRTCDATDPLGAYLYVDDADFVASGIYDGCTVFNASTGEMAAIVQITDANHIVSFPLSGTGNNGWTIGDNYSIFENEQCTIAGGNLVAVDENQDPIPPVFQSPNVQIDRTSSSSATINSLTNAGIAEAVWDEPIIDHTIDETMGRVMLHNEYNGQIHIDTVNGTASSIYPYGTSKNPINNLTDAFIAGSTHNINHYEIKGNLTVNGEDLTGKTLLAHRSLGNTITINSMVNTHSCYFEHVTLSGTLTGDVRITYCVLGEIKNFSGGIKNSLLTDKLTITGTGINYLTDCDTYITDLTSLKEIDIGNATLNLIRFRGGVLFSNKTSSNVLAVDLVAGLVMVTNTCSAGTIVIGGNCEVTDNSAAGCDVIIKALSNPLISDTVWEELKSEHTNSGSMGDHVRRIRNQKV